MQTRRLLILLLSLWLPLQGLAGVLSPQCPHHANRASAVEAASHAAMDHGAHHTHQYADTAYAGHAGHAQTNDVAQCDHCEPCHLGTGFLLTSLLTLAAPPPESFGAAATDHRLPMVFIDGPHRPPRPTLA